MKNKLDNIEIISNKNVEIKKQILNGEQFIVAPAVILVEGVHSGTGGPVFYSKEQIENSAHLWNGTILTANHPLDENGNPVSANSPEIVNKYEIGMFFNSIFENDKLKGEMWFSENRLSLKFPEILKMLENEEDIEISTSLYSNSDGFSNFWNEEKHNGSVSNFIPDHIAVLGRTKGACSFNDGCGIRSNVNMQINFNKENSMKREEIVDKMLNNEEFCKDLKLDKETDREFLSKADDKSFSLVQNAFERIVGCDCMKENEKKEEKPIQNEKKEEKPIQNEEKEIKTVEDFISNAPGEMKDVLNEGIKLHRTKKTTLVKQLLSNSRNKFSEEKLNSKDINELEMLNELADLPVNFEGKNYITSNAALKSNERKSNGYGVPDCPVINWKE